MNILKKKTCIIAWIIFLFSIMPMQVFSNATEVPASVEMRGLWVTTAYNLDWPSRGGLSNAEMKAEADVILQRAVAQGINAIFLQVRPAADAIYPSEIFPWSRTISGTLGVAPAENFDLLEYWITQSHALGIELHAWLNPYRITMPNQNITNVAELNETHPARLNPSLAVAHDTALFFDPGNPTARKLIIDGVAELLKNYNLDGIHLDDYFYPSRNFNDAVSYALYGAGMDLHEWRRENVNILIRDLQTVVRETNPRARYGISPFAIWQNSSSDPSGSATRGNESYNSMYADTRLWVQEGWLDYIAPQIYWYIGFEIACYEILLTWWENLVRGTDVDLYIGHAIYNEVDNRNFWDGETLRQLERNAISDVVKGSIFFRAVHMNSGVGEQIAQFYGRVVPKEIPTPPANAPTVQMTSLTVVQPRTNRFEVTDASGFYFFGAAVPNVPVYVNGQLIENRTAEGFYSVFMPIVRGDNTFTFTQEGQASITRTIVNKAPAPPAQPTTMTQPSLLNPSPSANEYARVGETVTLSVNAPTGATVTAQIGDRTINLTQTTGTTLTSTADRIYSARFTGSFTLNTEAPTTAIIDLGKPVYSMTWNGETRTATAAGAINQIGVDAPFFAEITTENAWAFPGASTGGGSHWTLLRGQRDRVAAVSGGWTRLVCGAWVESTNVRTFRDENLQPSDALGFYSEGRYISGENDKIIWDIPFYPAVYAEFDGKQLIVSLAMQNTAPPVFFNPEESIFSSVVRGVHNGAAAYFMTVHEDKNLEGFYTAFENGQLILHLKNRRTLTRGNYPFKGFTFVIDAGHGGSDPGAIGPMGSTMTESMLVHRQATLLTQHLEKLGAEVINTRTDDGTFLELIERVTINRTVKPDMFISLHTNATAETTNATNIHGFTVWYRNQNSRRAAEVFMNSMRYVNPLSNRNNAPNHANFFVVRPVWSPAILLEASFTNNIQDFSWMINPRRQNDYAWGIVNALLKYYA